jgi:two-component system sensor histidine kinase KdpD
VIVIGAAETATTPAAVRGVQGAEPLSAGKAFPWRRHAAALGVTAICTLIAWGMYPGFELTNLVMIYLLGAAIAGWRFGRGPAVTVSVCNVAILDFLFVPPRYTFEFSDLQYGVTFVIMLVVALAIAHLMASVRLQTRIAGHRERRTAALYAMSRELSLTRDAASMMTVAARHVEEVFASRAMVLLPAEDGRLRYPEESAQTSLWRADLSVAQWVYLHGAPAGLGTDTLAGAGALYLPLLGSRRTLGVLALLPESPRRILLPEQRHLLETFAGQLALSLERVALATEAEAVRVTAETEALRSTLLSSISHDLRTPLAVIVGASSTLAAHPELEVARRRELATTIHERASNMSALVTNVLELMRFESGGVQLRRDEYDLGELVGTALHGLETPLARHRVQVDLPADLPALQVDGRLIGQVLHNLLENAARYTPAGTRLWITATAYPDEVRVLVEDDGPGLPPGEPGRLFEKFQRGQVEGAVAGGGLGLAICKAIIEAHGGRIAAGTRPGGGARFEFSLPLAAAPNESAAP